MSKEIDLSKKPVDVFKDLSGLPETPYLTKMRDYCNDPVDPESEPSESYQPVNFERRWSPPGAFFPMPDAATKAIDEIIKRLK